MATFYPETRLLAEIPAQADRGNECHSRVQLVESAACLISTFVVGSVLPYQAGVQHRAGIEFKTAAESEVIAQTGSDVETVAERVLLLVAVAVVEQPVVAVS